MLVLIGWERGMRLHALVNAVLGLELGRCGPAPS